MDLSLPAIFGAGLLTFASPCVLPLIPIYLATLVGGGLGEAKARRAVPRAAAFSLGFTLVFVALGALASTLGGLLVQHRILIMALSGGLMVLFGLRSLGLVRVQALDADARPGLERIEASSSMAGAFVFGAAFALGWSPCIGPVLASVLTYAATQAGSPWHGAAYLGVYASGIALPLLLIASAVSRASALLKRFRAAIPVLERVTGGALVVLGVWTLAGLAPTGTEPVRTTAQHGAPASAPDAVAEACDADAKGDGLCGLPATATTADAPDGEQQKVQGAHMLEFTAHECPVCRRMRPVLDRIVAACRELEPRIVRVDVATARGHALALQHGVRGTPTFVLFDEAGQERARLLGEQSSDEVAAAVERAFGLSCSG